MNAKRAVFSNQGLVAQAAGCDQEQVLLNLSNDGALIASADEPVPIPMKRALWRHQPHPREL
jgi:hypothetical protein